MSKLHRALFATKVRVTKHLAVAEVNQFKANLSEASSSMEHLKPYLLMVDKEKNPDLLSIAFDSAVINLVNDNDDGMTTKPLLKMLDSIPFKFINVEHDRNYVVGVTTTFGAVKLDDKSVLDLSSLLVKGNDDEEDDEDEYEYEDEVGEGESSEIEYKDPFYLCIGGLIWKSVDPNLCNLIEEASNPNSPFYQEFSTSWEVGFDQYAIAKGSKRLKDAEIISDEEQVKELSKFLKCNGGSGFLNDGTPVYRVITDDDPLFMGMGITSNPAAAVSGILTASNKNYNKDENNISQPINLPVIKNDMIIKDISDITEESLKEMKASTIRDFIKDEIRSKGDELNVQIQATAAEKDRLATELESYRTKASSLEATSASLQTQIEALEAELGSIKASQLAAEKAEKFNLRIQSLVSEFELNDESRQVVASQIKDLDDASFDSWKSSFAILTKITPKVASAATDNIQAATVVVASVQTPASSMANTTSSQSNTFEQFKKAFKLDVTKGQFTI